jgi:hypothetical protein
VEDTEVGVEVDQGVVTLTGTVASYAKKLAAKAAAHRVTGVLEVANDCNHRVRNGRVGDAPVSHPPALCLALRSTCPGATRCLR